MWFMKEWKKKKLRMIETQEENTHAETQEETTYLDNETFQTLLLDALDVETVKEKIRRLFDSSLIAQEREGMETLLQNLQQENQRLSSELGEQKEAARQLTLQVEQTRGKLEETEQSSAALEQENACLKADRIALTQQAQQQEKSLIAYQEENNRAHSELQQIQQSIQMFKREKENLNAENETLQEQIARQTQSAATLQNELETTRMQAESLEQEISRLESEKDALSLQTGSLKEQMSPFVPLMESFVQYRKLPKQIRLELRAILPDDTPTHFLIFGCQLNNALAFWDYVRTRAERLPHTSMEQMRTVLTYLFDQINALYTIPIYELMTEEDGKSYDDRRHMRSSDCSRYQGTIQEVIWPGIWNENKNTAVRKCLVRF